MVTEQQRVMFRPSVVIGLGGMGTYVTWRVKQLVQAQLDKEVALGIITEDQRNDALNTRFQFVGIDSHRNSEQSQHLNPFYQVGTLQGVNQIVRRLFTQPSFKEWWPENFTNPGNFDNGAGHMHLRGRLAYVLERENGLDVGAKAREAVQAALRLIPNAPFSGARVPPVTIFVCTSLAGGTGGGMFLTILQSIKKLAGEGEFRLHAVIIDQSITKFGAANQQMQTVEEANNFAGLIELDAWMNPDPSLLEAVGWRSFMPAEHGVTEIRGERPVADFVWIYTMQNSGGIVMQDQATAIAQTADTLAAWIHSSSTADREGLDADINAWVADFSAAPKQLGRSSSYGAMGVAHLEFPAHRVLAYRAASLAIQVAQNHLLGSVTATRQTILSDVLEFMGELGIREQGYDQLLEPLRAIRRDRSIPPAPQIVAMLQQTRQSHALTAKSALESLVTTQGRFTRFRQACSARLSEKLSGEGGPADGDRGRIFGKVQDLVASGPDGLALAKEFLQTMRSQIAEQDETSLRDELTGLLPTVGLLPRQEARKRDVMQGAQDIGRGPKKFVPRGVDDQIRRFADGPFRMYLDTCEEVIVREEALRFYEALLGEVDLLLGGIDATRDALRIAVDQLRAIEARALQRPPISQAGGVTVDVLCSPQQIEHAFGWDDDATQRVASDVIRLDTDGILARFRTFCSLQRDVERREPGSFDRFEARRAETAMRFKDVLHDAGAVVLAGIRDITVWDALELELLSERPASDSAAKRAYISLKLATLVGAAQPMFALNSGALTGRAEAAQASIMIIAETDAVEQFGQRIGAPISWLSEALQPHLSSFVAHSVNTPDTHRVTLSYRLIGFPLMAMSPNLVSIGQSAVNQLDERWLLWSDRRASRLPRHFEPIEKAKIDYIAGLALGFGVLAYNIRDDNTPDRARIYYRGARKIFSSRSVFASGVRDLLERFEREPETVEQLADEISSAFDAIPRREWIEKVRIAEDGLLEDAGRTDADRAQALGRMATSIAEVLQGVVRDYNPNRAETDQVLDNLRPHMRN